MLSVAALVIVCLANILLGLVILANNSRVLLNRVFGSLTFIIASWSIVAYLEDVPGAQQYIQTLAVLDYLLAAVMVALFYWFCRLLTNTKFKLIDTAILILTPATASLSVLGEIVEPTLQSGNNVSLVPQFGYIVFIILFVTGIGGGLAYLIYRRSHSSGQNRAQQSTVGLGLSLSVGLLLIADIIAPIVFNISNTEVARIGIYGILFFTSFSTFAIARHRLFDIRRLIARSLTYILLVITLGAGYVIVAFGVSHLIFGSSTGSIQQTLLYGVLSLILAYTFQPLRAGFERLTARIFYQDTYEPRALLDAISRVLVSEIDIDRMLERSLHTVASEMRIQFGQLVIFNQDRVYRVGHYGPLPRRLLVAPELRQFGTGMVVADALTSGVRKELLLGHGLQIALGLKTSEEFVGYLLLGDKLSGSAYTQADLELLAIIGKELAVGISNAKAYAEISAFNITLQDRVNHATSRLRVANRHLKELDKTKDEFLSMASHQLRTPLTTIKGYLSMMTEGDAGKLTATQQEFVNYAFDASERMVNLISDLLNVSRLEAGKFLIQTKPTDIVAMVADEVRQLQQHAVNKNLELIFVPPTDELPLVAIDEGKTRQVVMNFVDNAIYYTKTGNVTVKLSKTSTGLKLEVTDTGIGVPDDAKKKLFQKFYRAENAQGIRPDGTGLGLYLARRVVTDQGGTIIFRSSEGQGSTFGFELPLPKVTEKAHPTHG